MGALLGGEILAAASSPPPAAENQYLVLKLASVAVLAVLIALSYFTRAGTIARATTKEAVRQPVFLLVMAVGILIIVANIFIPFFSMGDDTKMFKDCGLATILICALLHAIWTASVSVAEEIEGKTAMTLLSKPINRRQFIFGKYVGIVQSVVILMLIVGTVFFVCTYFKYGYDQRESGGGTVALFEAGAGPLGLVEARLNSALSILPGLALIFLEVAVMTAVSVAISTRMPMMVNIVACLAIFVVGHLTPVLVESTLGELEFVNLFARVLAVFLPALDFFNIQAAVATGARVPNDYVGFAALYSLAYGTAAIMLAFLLFEDRDLA